MTRKRKRDPLGDRILTMVKAGIPPDQIARAVGCRKPYIYVVLFRKGYEMLRLNPLEDDQQRWLLGQAAKAKVSVNEMARAILIDAIHEARELEKKK